jgi:hypothetical protein
MASGEIDITPGRVFGPEELITHQKLNDLGAPTLRLKELSITSRELADGAISADKLDVELEAQLGVPDGSVTTAKIVDDAVTTPKIAPGVTLDQPVIVPVTGVGVTGFRPEGVLLSNALNTANAGGTEETVWTYTCPANLLNRNGDALRITSFVVNATAVAGTKNFRWKFDGVNAFVISSAQVVTVFWAVTLLIARTSLTSQRATATQFNSAGGVSVDTLTLSSTLSSAIPLSFTLQTSVGANSIRHQASFVEFIPTP